MTHVPFDVFHTSLIAVRKQNSLALIAFFLPDQHIYKTQEYSYSTIFPPKLLNRNYVLPSPFEDLLKISHS